MGRTRSAVFFGRLNRIAKNLNKNYKLIDKFDENLTSKQIKKLRVIFISSNTENHINRLDEACSMIGKEHWKDPAASTSTAHAYSFELIYIVDLKLCNGLIQNECYTLAADLLIALLFTMRNWPNCFYDTDDPYSAQQILTQFGFLWKQIIGNKELTDIIDIDRNTKKILYEIIDELAKDFNNLDTKYTLKFGKYKFVENINWIDPSSLNQTKLFVDFNNQCIICPIMDHMVPFHIKTIKNSSIFTNTSRTYLRINFISPHKSHFIKELHYCNHDGANLQSIHQKLKKLQKTYNNTCNDKNNNKKKKINDFLSENDIISNSNNYKRRNIIKNKEDKENKENEKTNVLDNNSLNKLKVVDLKEMCKKKGFLRSGSKSKLIWRLLNPEQHILELKRNYHYTKTIKQGYTFCGGESERYIDEQMTRIRQFDKNRYVFENGKVVQKRCEWLLDLKGGYLMIGI